MASLSPLIADVRSYRDRHPELLQAHHFLFALPVDAPDLQPDVLVMGLNPGEQTTNWNIHPGPTEETAEYDWLEEVGGRTGPGKRWRKHLQNFCGQRRTMMSEFFFWSSANSHKAFKQTFGTGLLMSPHLPFCREMNIKLINVVGTSGVLCPGLSHASQLAQLYGLRHVRDVLADNGHYLVRHYESDSMPWLFTKHWSGGFGFSLDQRKQVKEYIDEQLPVSSV